jgi:hypothetical protein
VLTKIEVEIRGKNGERLMKEISGNQQSWEVPFAVHSVELVPHFNILHWREEYRREAEALAKGNPNDPFGVSFLLHNAISQILFDQDRLDESQKHIRSALAVPNEKNVCLDCI